MIATKEASMKRLLTLGLLIVPLCCLAATNDAVEVDFLKLYNLKVNGAGPLLVRANAQRNRIVLVNTYTSSVSLVDGTDHAVENIPIQSRVPQYLKNTALTIDRKTGNIVIVGEKSIHVVFPDEKRAVSFPTGKQAEMVAVDENTGNVFFVGREDRRVGLLDLKKGTIKSVPTFDREEKLVNLNATPPPSIRKVVCDAGLGKTFVTDGYTATLFTFSTKDGKRLSERKLDLKEGSRWHFAGYDDQTHALYVVIETNARKVVQAAKIDVEGGNDRFVDLPELTEGVGVTFNPARDEIYIPYDNHPVVHVVDFKTGEVIEVKIPAYGNDASAVDEENNRLYVTSWAYGEIDVIDLNERKLAQRIPDAGIIPHMFSIALNPTNRKLYVPLGATAVNGSHGSALTVFDTRDFSTEKIYTGWAPVDLIRAKDKESFLVFNAEDAFAEVFPDGSFQHHKLPFPYPRSVVATQKGNVYLAYGPHQSYWPAVYIWAAKNGILEIEPKNLDLPENRFSDFLTYDRRIPRLAQGIALDTTGALWGLQNSWGNEQQFLTCFPEGIRMFAPQERIALGDTIIRETIPRILEYDKAENNLYVVKLGEQEEDNGKLIILDAGTKKPKHILQTGRTPTDLVFDDRFIYVSNFDDNTISKFDKKTFATSIVKTGRKPLKMVLAGGSLFVINHNDNTLQKIGEKTTTHRIGFAGHPDNLFHADGKLILTSHNPDALRILAFDRQTKTFSLLYEKHYPYGETTFDTNNSSFYTRGQFGDAIFEITKIKTDAQNRLWVTDFLSGKLFIISMD